MKVLFVYPEYQRGGFKPINISLLSAILAQHGHERKLFDVSMYDIPIKGRVDDKCVAEELLYFPHTEMPEAANFKINMHFTKAFNKVLKEYQPHLVAFSTTSIPYVIVKALAESIHLDKRPPLAIGGIHTISDPEEVVMSDLFDYICFGEGEQGIIGIMEHLSEKRGSNEIPNVYVKENGEYIKNPPAPLIRNLDDLPFYDWSIYDEYHFWRPYQGKAYKMGEYMTSRGCPYQCLFCLYSTFFNFYKKEKRVRFLSAERVVSEIAELKERYNLEFIKMFDSDFLLRNEDIFGELMELYASRIAIPFAIQTNARSITKNKAKMLKKGNCISAGIGVESGSEKLRHEVLNKKVTNDLIIESVSILKEHGIRVTTNNLMGFPNETEEDIRETISLNRKLEVDLAETNYFYPFKGTKLGNLCYERGWVKDHSEELSNYRFQTFLNMPQIKPDVLLGLKRTFQLYMRLPEWLDPLIALAEKNDDTGIQVNKVLHDIVQKMINKGVSNH